MKQLFITIIMLFGISMLHAAEHQVVKFDPQNINRDTIEKFDQFEFQMKFDIHQFFTCVDRCGIKKTHPLYRIYQDIQKDLNLDLIPFVETCRRLEKVAQKDDIQKYYAQAMTFSAEEPWQLFISNTLKAYKEQLQQENLVSFPSISKPYVDLEEKTKEYFQANDTILWQESTVAVKGFFMAQVLLRYLRNIALEKQKEEFLRTIKKS